MRILMVTWEFPPNKVGGIGSHCHDLSRSLVKSNHDVHVITYGDVEKEEQMEGVTVHRVPSTKYAPDMISWSMYLGHKMEKIAVSLHKEKKFDLVHAHDWMMVPAGVGIKKILKLPMVFTLHSAEQGRSGVHDSYTKMINDLEWYGTYEASQIITVGKEFRNEVSALFYPPQEKLHYIPNGVDIAKFEDLKYFVDRKDYAMDWEKIVLFVGRLTHQKGVEHLIGAIPLILDKHKEAKFVFVGGGALDYYRGLATAKGVMPKTFFTGYMDDPWIPAIYKIADVSVAPSVYEPFGIVALESAAARTPVIGSYTGGLKETIIHEWTGLHSYPADPKSIAAQVNRVLDDISWGDWMGENGRRMVEKNYTWDRIAYWTSGVYGKALGLWK